MRRRHEVTDELWERMASLLPGQAGAPGVTADNRLFVNAIYWIARTGAPWSEICRTDSGNGIAFSNG